MKELRVNCDEKSSIYASSTKSNYGQLYSWSDSEYFKLIMMFLRALEAR